MSDTLKDPEYSLWEKAGFFDAVGLCGSEFAPQSAYPSPAGYNELLTFAQSLDINSISLLRLIGIEISYRVYDPYILFRCFCILRRSMDRAYILDELWRKIDLPSRNLDFFESCFSFLQGVGSHRLFQSDEFLLFWEHFDEHASFSQVAETVSFNACLRGFPKSKAATSLAKRKPCEKDLMVFIIDLYDSSYYCPPEDIFCSFHFYESDKMLPFFTDELGLLPCLQKDSVFVKGIYQMVAIRHRKQAHAALGAFRQKILSL